MYFVRILKGFKVKAQGEVKRSPGIQDVNIKLGLKARQVMKNEKLKSQIKNNQ